MMPGTFLGQATLGTTPGATVASHQAMAGRQPLFSHIEVETLRADDSHAATAIVGILLTILTLGLLGYLTIAFLVSQGPS